MRRRLLHQQSRGRRNLDRFGYLQISPGHHITRRRPGKPNGFRALRHPIHPGGDSHIRRTAPLPVRNSNRHRLRPRCVITRAHAAPAAPLARLRIRRPSSRSHIHRHRNIRRRFRTRRHGSRHPHRLRPAPLIHPRNRSALRVSETQRNRRTRIGNEKLRIRHIHRAPHRGRPRNLHRLQPFRIITVRSGCHLNRLTPLRHPRRDADRELIVIHHPIPGHREIRPRISPARSGRRQRHRHLRGAGQHRRRPRESGRHRHIHRPGALRRARRTHRQRNISIIIDNRYRIRPDGR